MGKYVRELDSAPSIDGGSLIAVSESTTDTSFKSTVNNLTSNLETINTRSTGNKSGIGSISSAGGTSAILTNPVDFDAITIGTRIDIGIYNFFVEGKVSPDLLNVYPDVASFSNTTFTYIYPYLGNVNVSGTASSYIHDNLVRFKSDVDFTGKITSKGGFTVEQGLTVDSGGVIVVTGGVDIQVGDLNISGDLTCDGVLNVSNIDTDTITCDNLTTNSVRAERTLSANSGPDKDRYRIYNNTATNLRLNITPKGVIQTPDKESFRAVLLQQQIINKKDQNQTVLFYIRDDDSSPFAWDNTGGFYSPTSTYTHQSSAGDNIYPYLFPDADGIFLIEARVNISGNLYFAEQFETVDFYMTSNYPSGTNFLKSTYMIVNTKPSELLAFNIYLSISDIFPMKIGTELTCYIDNNLSTGINLDPEESFFTMTRLL